MSWQATIVVNNNTDYNIDIVHNLPEGLLTTMKPRETGFTWTTSDTNNTIAFKFWSEPNTFAIQGSLAYGPNSGVYVDRGWIDPEGRQVVEVADANGVQFVQSSNGGKQLLAWNQFEDGGLITLTFNS